MKKIIRSTWLKAFIVLLVLGLPITGVLAYADKKYNVQRIASPSIAPTPTSKKLSPTPGKEGIKNNNNYQSNSDQNISVLGTESKNSSLKTYPIIPLGDLSGSYGDERQRIIDIYNEFLKTPNLRYLTPQQQEELLRQKISTYLDNYKRQLEQEKGQVQENINQLKQQLNQQTQPTSTPIPTLFVSPAIESALSQLSQTLTSIQNQPVAMNVIEGRKQNAYQDWINNNQAIYAQIIGSRYQYDLSSVLAAHGM